MKTIYFKLLIKIFFIVLFLLLIAFNIKNNSSFSLILYTLENISVALIMVLFFSFGSVFTLLSIYNLEVRKNKIEKLKNKKTNKEK